MACFRLGSRTVAVLARCHGRVDYQADRTSVRVGEDTFPVLDVAARVGLASAEQDVDLVLVEEDGARAALKVVGPARMTRIEPVDLKSVPDLYPREERLLWAGLLPTESGDLLPVLSLAGLLGER